MVIPLPFFLNSTITSTITDATIWSGSLRLTSDESRSLEKVAMLRRSR